MESTHSDPLLWRCSQCASPSVGVPWRCFRSTVSGMPTGRHGNAARCRVTVCFAAAQFRNWSLRGSSFGSGDGGASGDHIPHHAARDLAARIALLRYRFPNGKPRTPRKTARGAGGVESLREEKADVVPDLSGTSLTGTHLKGANLHEANLSGGTSSRRFLSRRISAERNS
jgi:hypothetical protein